MKKKGAQCVFFVLVLGGQGNLFGANFEQYVVYLHQPGASPTVPPFSKGCPSGPCYTPSEFGLENRFAACQRATSPASIVPDGSRSEGHVEGEVLPDRAIITPLAQEMEDALDRSVLGIASAASLIGVQGATFSSVKRIVCLLKDLAEQARENPGLVKIVIQATPEISDFRAFFACSEQLQETRASGRKRRSFHGEDSELSLACMSEMTRARSTSFEREEQKKHN